MTITERDKKLLVVLAVVVLVLGIGVGVCMPLFKKGTQLQESVAKARDLKTENEEKVASLPQFEQTLQQLNVKIADIEKNFYPMMKSMEIDRMLTETALSHGTTMNNLDIAMPQTGVTTNLVDYNTIVNATDTQTDTASASSEEGASYAGLYTATADMTMTGSRKAIQEVIDDLAAAEPKIRITNLTWQNATRTSDYAAEVKLEIYMYESTEQFIAEQQEAAAAAATEEAADGTTTDSTSTEAAADAAAAE